MYKINHEGVSFKLIKYLLYFRVVII